MKKENTKEKAEKTANTTWRAIKIEFPKALEPLYDFLQWQYNTLLGSEPYRSYILETPVKMKGRKLSNSKFRDLLYPKISEFIKSWNIPNPVWHGRMLIEQIRRLKLSLEDKIQIFKILETHDFKKTKAFWENLHEKGLFPTSGFVENLIKSGRAPVLPFYGIFVLDYADSSCCNFVMDKNHNCRIQVEKKRWVGYEILIPINVREGYTFHISKPRFWKDKETGIPQGAVSYEVEIPDFGGENVLGVDVGKVKLFSAGCIFKDGSYSREYLPGKTLQKYVDKLERLQEELKDLYDKIDRVNRLKGGVTRSPRQKRRREKAKLLRSSISRLKIDIVKRGASELISLAKFYGCKTIYLENLTWLGEKGGKWNFSEFFSWIENSAELSGIEVIYKNCKNTSKKHPVTGEIGKTSGREVIFSNEERWDRDNLAHLNIGQDEEHIIKEIQKEKRASARVKKKSRKKELRKVYKQARKQTEISKAVVFPPEMTSKDVVWGDGCYRLVANIQTNSLLQKRSHYLRGCPQKVAFAQ